MTVSLNWRKLESKWQKKWKESKIFESDPDPNKNKYYITVAYPYPNSPQHIGHTRTYTLADVHARYMRMKGYNVLFPMAMHYTGTPVLAMSKRLAEGDREIYETFLKVYKVPTEEIEKFVDPIKLARYFHEEIKTGMIATGYSFDWRREFTTIDPEYSCFIEWQFRKLREAGFISRGSHPVGWCPSCGNPVGQHDTVGDVEPEIVEFVLVKFEYDGFMLPAATLRPETVYGVTNLWLNPREEYVKAEVDNSQWIISKKSVGKFRFLGYVVNVKDTFLGADLIGRRIRNPINDRETIILPADFVDPGNATGVVMSVPAHAPYDFMALESLKKESESLKTFGIPKEALEEINPLPIISLPDYSKYPAEDIIRKLKITSQKDPRLEDATKEIYRYEYHRGNMKKNTGRYSGLSVAEAKKQIQEALLKDGKSEIMYELGKEVICRCGANCIVKIFENQWFIDYGDPNWKRLVHECLDQLEINPKELHSEFKYVVDWLHERACARKGGLGTKLPWDSEWIIEALSDSVIYMAYYTIANLIRDYSIQAQQLNDSVFDYVFLGIGDVEELEEETGIDQFILHQMRNSFTYFYPLDSRHSGRDLIQNHLTFMIFIHRAIFPSELCPRQIVVNGSILMEGRKMSKSLGNIIPLKEAIDSFGADPLRISVMGTAELLQDVDFSSSLAQSMRSRLEKFYQFATGVTNDLYKNLEESDEDFFKPLDEWMLSRLQNHIRAATESMDNIMVRKTIHSALFSLDQDIQWYLKRIRIEKSEPSRMTAINQVLREILSAKVRLLAPITPHVCEEIWEKMEMDDFVSIAPWPSYREEKINRKREEEEELIKRVVGDTQKILKTTGIKPKRICYYVSDLWKYEIYLESLRKSLSERISFGDLMKEFSKNPSLKMKKKLAGFVQTLIDDLNRTVKETKKTRLEIEVLDEKRVLKESKTFFEAEFKTKIDVFSENDPDRYDPKKRARFARPYRPGIYLE